MVDESSTGFGSVVMEGTSPFVGWQVKLCDPVWHASSCSAETTKSKHKNIVFANLSPRLHTYSSNSLDWPSTGRIPVPPGNEFSDLHQILQQKINRKIISLWRCQKRKWRQEWLAEVGPITRMYHILKGMSCAKVMVNSRPYNCVWYAPFGGLGWT